MRLWKRHVGWVVANGANAWCACAIIPSCWLGRQDSNLRMPVPKTGALPLGDAPAGRLRLTGRGR